LDSILALLQAYPGPSALGLLVICGLGLPPWSEELILLGSGYFVAQGAIPYSHALVWCLVGILGGDSLIFLLGRTVGERVYRWPLLRRHMGTKQRARFNRRFLQEGTKAIFLARFIPGYRMLAYFVAGNLGMPMWKFVLLDSIGAVVTVPISIWVGHLFADNLDAALAVVDDFQIPLVLVAGLVLFLLLRRAGLKRRTRLLLLRRIRHHRQQEAEERERDTASPADDSRPGE